MSQVKKISVFGKNIKYETVEQLSKKLNIEKEDGRREKIKNAIQARKNIKTPLIIYDEVSGKFDKINLKDKPLLIKEFCNSQRLSNKLKNKILKHDYKSEELYIKETDDEFIKLLDKGTKFTEEDELALKYKVSFRILHSAMDGTKRKGSRRNITRKYIGQISQSDYNNLNHIIIEVDKQKLSNSSFFYNKNPLEERKIADQTYYLRKWIESRNGVEVEILNEVVEERRIDEFSPFILKVIKDIYRDYSWTSHIIIESIECKNYNKNLLFDLKRMKLKMASSYDITCNIYNEIIDIPLEKGENCVLKYLENKYKQKRQNIATTYFKNSNVAEGISTEEIKNFCSLYKIKMIAYDILGNTIEKYKPEQKTKRANLIYIAYNNHIYPLKNKVLHRRLNINYKLENLSSEIAVIKEFDKLINKKIIPSNVSINDINNVTSFIHDNTLYFNNPSYNLSYKILSLFNIEDKIKHYTNEYSLIQNLEELYDITDTYSYFPQLSENKNFILNYVNRENYKDNLVTIDKNKAYPYALYDLGFLIRIDIRKHKIKTEFNENYEIIENYLYSATPEKSSILMPASGFFTGDFLIYCRTEGLLFTLIEEYETEEVENKFRSLIEDYYTKTGQIKGEDEQQFIKDAMNIYIGKMDRNVNINTYSTVEKICNNEESKLTAGTYVDYNDDLKIFVKETEKHSIYTRQPIKYQILNNSRKIIYEKMKELKLTDRDIVQIKTDAITINKNISLNKLNLSNSFKGWKISDGAILEKSMNYENEDIRLNDMKLYNNSSIHHGYAGCGKSYTIMNKIVPKILENKQSYIVLSPSHSSIEEYRNKKFNCNVIQTYVFNNKVPTEDIIIVDEMGLCNTRAFNVISKCLINKKVMLYGDFKQELPVKDQHCDSPFFLNSHFKQFINYENHRNNYTTEYYDKLINSELDLIEEIKKYQKKNMLDAEVVICHTNTLCDIYNEKIMSKLNLNKYSNGLKIMCKSNKLRHLNIYNNFMLTIVESDDETKILTIKDLNTEYKITYKQYEAFFKPSYARTLYNCQGKSLENGYYVAKESLKFYNTGRSAYTIISRIKEKIIHKEKESRNSDEILFKITL